MLPITDNALEGVLYGFRAKHLGTVLSVFWRGLSCLDAELTGFRSAVCEVGAAKDKPEVPNPKSADLNPTPPPRPNHPNSFPSPKHPKP